MFLRLILVCIVFLMTVILLRTFLISPYAHEVDSCSDKEETFISASKERVQRFQNALQFETISSERGVQEEDNLLAFQKFIIKSYPTIHNSKHVDFEIVKNLSLLYHVKGSKPHLRPYMLMAHLDVVPTEDQIWHFPPFSGSVVDGYIRGRGAIDDKHMVMAILEAVEFLLSNGAVPKRSFFVAFGHDEEIMGYDGARNIAKVLKHKGINSLEYILDEGLTVVHKALPGINYIGLIGTSEKGMLTVKLTVEEKTGGHSSMPNKESVIGILAQAISRLENNPLPSQFGNGPEIETFEHAASYMPFHLRLIFHNLWLFKPIVVWFLSQKPTTNAMIRTTTAVTMINGGVKSNVIPTEASAIVNHRIHPAQSIEEIIELDRKVIADPRINIEIVEGSEPLKMSSSGPHVFGYNTLKDTIREIWGYKENLVVVPALMVGATDTKHYMEFSDNVYRFSPTLLCNDNVTLFHGANEQISVSNYEEAINFYYHLIRNSDAETLPGMLDHNHSSEL